MRVALQLHSLNLGIFLLDDGNVVALQHDPAELPLRVLLQVNFGRFVQHEVHILVKPYSKSRE